jgi:hypothetical protein
MHGCVILYRIGRSGKVQYVMTEDGELSEFDNMNRAVEYADNNRLFQSGQANYQIVELDEL